MDVVEGTGRRAAAASSRAATGVSTRARSGASHVAEFVEEKLDDWDVKDGVEKAIDKGVDALKRK